MTISCDRVGELAPGFVLGALDASEMAAVHEHLIACREPHAELREFGGVVPYLAVALEPVEPPARLRAAVIAAAQADLAAHPRSAQATARGMATLPISTSVGQMPAPEIATAPQAPAASGGTIVSLASARRSRTRRALAWATRVAAAVAVVVLVGYGFGVIREPGARPSPSGVDHLQGNQNRFGVLAPLGAGHAQGFVVLMPTNHLYVYVNGLAPTSGDQVYMVWVTAGKDVSLAGYFRVDAQGDGTGEMDNVPRASSLWVQVCIEPNEHVTKPTGPTVASGTVQT